MYRGFCETGQGNFVSVLAEDIMALADYVQIGMNLQLDKNKKNWNTLQTGIQFWKRTSNPGLQKYYNNSV